MLVDVDTNAAPARDLGSHDLVGRPHPAHGLRKGVDPEIAVEPGGRQALHVGERRFEERADFVGPIAQAVAEQRAQHDPAHGGAQLRVRVQPPARRPRVESLVDLLNDDLHMGVDALQRERRLHQAAPALVIGTVRHHQGGGAVDDFEHFEGGRPFEVGGVRPEHMLVRLCAEHVHVSQRSVAHVDDVAVATTQLDERGSGVANHAEGNPQLRERPRACRAHGHDPLAAPPSRPLINVSRTRSTSARAARGSAARAM